jgi:chromosome segregation ATPase
LLLLFKGAVLMQLLNRLASLAMAWIVAATLCLPLAVAQETEPKPQVDAARLNEINARLRELKGLLSEYGMGHPKVQDLLRRIKLVEEEVRFEQTYIERIAAQLRSAEEELRNRQKQDWIDLNTVQDQMDEDAGGLVPSLETVDAMERECLLEIQRIDWDLASEEAEERNPAVDRQLQADEIRLKAQQLARDSIRLKLEAEQKKYMLDKSRGERGQVSSAEVAASASAVQILANELKVAEAYLQAAELELTFKTEMAENSASRRVEKLKTRREIVHSHLKTLPKLKELARQVAQSYDSTDQISEQIREIEAQRMLYQTKMVEQQAMLDLIRQAMSPQSSPKSPSKTID